jgi:hypothetical protein
MNFVSFAFQLKRVEKSIFNTLADAKKDPILGSKIHG